MVASLAAVAASPVAVASRRLLVEVVAGEAFIEQRYREAVAAQGPPLRPGVAVAGDNVFAADAARHNFYRVVLPRLWEEQEARRMQASQVVVNADFRGAVVGVTDIEDVIESTVSRAQRAGRLSA